MYADLEHQIVVALALLIQAKHGLPHAQRCGDGTIRRGEGCHDRISDRLHHRTRLGGNNFGQHSKMRAHKVIGNQVAHPVVQRG